jgi:hypothetical protein
VINEAAMLLNEDHIKIISLRLRKLKYKCPVCKQRKFTINQQMFAAPLIGATELIYDNPIQLVAVICDKCFNVQSFFAKPEGILDAPDIQKAG